MENMTNAEIDKALAECQGVLENHLQESTKITINNDTCQRFDIDNIVANHLVENGYERFLIEDVTQGFMVGGISELALCRFAQSKKVFKGKVGNFIIKQDYAMHSVRYFEAHHYK